MQKQAQGQKSNLASEGLGARVLGANDEWFAECENLVKDSEAIFLPDKYVATGKWMDGWESRRRRQPGFDTAVVRLAGRGTIDEIIVDTAHFTGNYPPEASVEGFDLPQDASFEDIFNSEGGTTVVPKSSLKGDSKHCFAVDSDQSFTHLRLRIYPDGGVARLRAFGQFNPNWDELDMDYGDEDLASLLLGARSVSCSDMFYGNANNLLQPFPSPNMGSGWETQRRRDSGNDWAIIELARPGYPRTLEIDSSHFKGNCPGMASVEALGHDPDKAWNERDDWQVLLPKTALLRHTVHGFRNQLNASALEKPISHLRISIFPDGGLARFRVYGRTARADQLMRGLQAKSRADEKELQEQLFSICASKQWSKHLAKAFPFSDLGQLMQVQEKLWRGLDSSEWLAAFSAHPKIGEKKEGDDQHSKWSRQEQSQAAGASEAVLKELADKNLAYQEKFGFVFLICATGKSAEQMLASLRARLKNSKEQEIAIAAEEQRKITRLRLIKWCLS